MPFNPLKPFAGLKLPHQVAGVTTEITYDRGLTKSKAQGTREACALYVEEMQKVYPANPYQARQVGEIASVEGKPGVFSVAVEHWTSSD